MDIYGEAAWTALGGGVTDGVMDLQITWPAGIAPFSSKGSHAASISSLIPLSLVVASITLLLFFS